MTIETVERLEELLSEPTDYAVEAMRKLEGDIIVLGAGGKMGPSLTTMAKRASDQAGVKRRVIAVDRWPASEQEDRLKAAGVETIKCDLLDPAELAKLPDAPNVLFMVGVKFGTSGQQGLTWAINSYLPGLVCNRYRGSRIVAFSTGNVYGLVPVKGAGSVETDDLNPVGEYAMSALGRERVLDYFSRSLGIPVTIVRLNYACEMRYGVLVDLAQKVFVGEPVDLSMGYLNTIWQGDSNAVTLAAFNHVESPPFVINITGREKLSIKTVAEQFGKIMGKKPTFTGTECPDALLSDSSKAFKLFGYPRVDEKQLIPWIADWVARGGESLGKPTHFESRDGKF
jgi:nucleoside-diphosphate-sugar epimerase